MSPFGGDEREAPHPVNDPCSGRRRPTDWLLVTWHDGRVLMETPAPVPLGKRLALTLLLTTADRQASLDEVAR